MERIYFLEEFVPAIRDYWWEFVKGDYNFARWFRINFPEIPAADLLAAKFYDLL